MLLLVQPHNRVISPAALMSCVAAAGGWTSPELVLDHLIWSDLTNRGTATTLLSFSVLLLASSETFIRTKLWDAAGAWHLCWLKLAQHKKYINIYKSHIPIITDKCFGAAHCTWMASEEGNCQKVKRFLLIMAHSESQQWSKTDN